MKLRKELPILLMAVLPFLYLAFIWKQLPDSVPLHWSLSGGADRYGSKNELPLMVAFLTLLPYTIMTFAPKMDPKQKLHKMGGKFFSLKLCLTCAMSALALYILYITKKGSIPNPNFIFLLVGILYAIIGNFLKTLRPNYFIGIKTPWTLENDIIWKKTHELGGKLFFTGGLLVILSSLLVGKDINFITFVTVTVLITLIPIIYSYVLYKKAPR